MINHRQKLSTLANIAFIMGDDPEDVHSFSGTPYHMVQELRRRGHQVNTIGPLRPSVNFIFRFRSLISRVISGRPYQYQHSALYSRLRSKLASVYLSQDKESEIVFVCNSSDAVAFLESERPLIYSSDATFDLMNSYHLAYQELPEQIQRDGERIESKALQNCDHAVFASGWAKKSAVEHYKVPEKKATVTPFGANLNGLHPEENPKKAPVSERIHLLYVGVNWEYKGGAIAVEALDRLLDAGHKACLHICGARLPKGFRHSHVIDHGFLDKGDPEDLQKLTSLYKKAHFFILPTRFECYGIVFAEAMAYGTPCLGTKTGGISTLIKDGVNGYLMNLEDRGEAYAERILNLIEDPEAYTEMSAQALKSYREKLNWRAWGDSIDEIIAQLLADKTSAV